jgi:hypothetical protein
MSDQSLIKSTPKLFLAGSKRVGKTSSTNYLKQKIPGTISLAFAEPLKLACKALFLLSDDQLYNEDEKEKIDPRWGVSPRKLLQKVGDLLRHGLQLVLPELKLDKGLILTQNMYWRLEEAERKNPPLLVIEDGRLPDEHNFFKTLEKTLSVRIQRNTGSTDQHSSEQINFQCDVNITNNDSLTHLYSQLDNILAHLQSFNSETQAVCSPISPEKKELELGVKVWRGDQISDMPHFEYYGNTFLLDEKQLELFKHRFDTTDPKRWSLHDPCRLEYVPVEHKNFYVRFCQFPDFNSYHFNCAQWSFGIPVNPSGIKWEFSEPCILFVFEWTDGWQHFMQDLVPVLVSAKPFLDQHPSYRLIVKKGVRTDWIRDLLDIVNPITEVAVNYSFRALSPTVITFDPQKNCQPPNLVSNIRKMEYYSQANDLIRKSICRRFPEVEEKVSPYILYLSRKGCSRTLRQDEEIRNLDPRIRVFNLQEQDVPFWDRLKLFYNASMIIVPHGGAIYHVLACRPNTPMIEIFGAGDFINCERLANGIPLQYFPLMSTNLKSHNSHEPYDIDVSLIKQIIDFVM